MKVHDWNELSLEEVTPLFYRKVVHTAGMTIANLSLKKDAHVVLHDHPNEQVSMVHSGRLLFHLGGQHIEVGPGQSLEIPPHLPHSVDVLEDCEVTDLFTPRREDWLTGNDAYLRKSQAAPAQS
ncbi:cupin domain-containing protein [Bryobacter aggregatus]|uniref:cupin domain-containing protein n=1 Tax=Bryobacter aggregatus TaxID=360054 RepID=UPI0004E1B905|nr:cupin domain-containing protein [Bryobacter aggregatus]